MNKVVFISCFYAIFCTLIFAEQIATEPAQNTFTDLRDGKTYHMVLIGGKTWMAENLNYQTGRSWCYDYDSSNCAKYARLYDWNTAVRACPAGWHLPTRKEWNDLMAAVGGIYDDNITTSKIYYIYWDEANTKLKSKTDTEDSDDYGFLATLGGRRGSDGNFYGAGRRGNWWSATENRSTVSRWMRSVNNFVRDFNHDVKYEGFSVRCVKN